MHSVRRVAPFLILGTLAGAGACSRRDAAAAAVAPLPAAGAATGKALAPWQGELLDLAWGAASALPANPHAKTRARLQEDVVDAMLELGQAERAQAAIPAIDGWRRGAAWADLAFQLATSGVRDEIDGWLDKASRIADAVLQDDSAQDWPRDRIRAKIARTWIVLGEPAKARAFATGLVAFERGRVDAVQAGQLAPADFDRALQSLEQAFATAGFDERRGAIDIAVQLWRRLPEADPRRDQLEDRLDRATVQVPLPVRIDLQLALARAATEREGRGKARRCLDQADALVRKGQWLPEDEVPVRARIAAGRFAAGDHDAARRELQAVEALYADTRTRIVDIWRSRALRPLAEAWQTAGDPAAARRVCADAATEGVHNPNSRPRAEDLVGLCLTMVRSGIEPDAALRARLQTIGQGLGDPW